MDLFTRRGRSAKVQSLASPVADISSIPYAGAGTNSDPYANPYAISQFPDKENFNAYQRPQDVAMNVDLKTRMQDLEERLQSLQGHYEKRLTQVHNDLSQKFDSRWQTFELYDKRFKEFVKTEQEISQSQIVNLRTSGLEYIMQKGENEAQVLQKLEIKCSNLNTRVMQLSAILEKVLTGELVPDDEVQGLGVLPGGLNTGMSPMKRKKAAIEAGVTPGDVHDLGSPRLLSANLIKNIGSNTAKPALNYNVLLEAIQRKLASESESRQILQEECNNQIRMLHDELKDFMRVQEADYNREKRLKLQQEHDNRILKISEGSVNNAFSKLKLELDVVHSKFDNAKQEEQYKGFEKEQLLIESIHGAKEGFMKSNKELWEAHIGMQNEWKAGLESLQILVDNKGALLAQELDRKVKAEHDYVGRHFIEQKKVNQGFGERLAKNEMVSLELQNELRARMESMKVEENRLEREFANVATVLGLVKSKVAEIGKNQQSVEKNALDRIKAEIEKVEQGCIKLASARYEQFQNDMDKLARKLDQTDLLNRENRKSCLGDIAAIEKKTQASMQDLTNSVTRVMQQSEFDQKALLATKLEEEKQYVITEIKAMEANNLAFRMQCNSKMEQTESSLIDRITSVDRKCYSALQAERRQIQQFEKNTNDNLAKHKHHQDNLRTKFQVRIEDQINDHKVAVAHDTAEMWRKIETESRQVEKNMGEMQRKIADHENKTTQTVQDMKDYWEDKFTREKENLEQTLKQTLVSAIEQERADRIKSESERLASMQARFEAFEEVVNQKSIELGQRIKNYCDTLDKKFEVFSKENENLVNEKTNDLQKEIIDYKEKVDDRLKQQKEGVDKFQAETEAKVLAHNHIYEKTMKMFMSLQMETLENDLIKIRANNRKTAQQMQRQVDNEKMERIKSLGEHRAALEDSLERKTNKQTERINEFEKKTDKSVNDLRDDLKDEKERRMELLTRLESDMRELVTKTENDLTNELKADADEKVQACQLASNAALEGAIAEIADTYHVKSDFTQWANDFIANVDQQIAKITESLTAFQDDVYPKDIEALQEKQQKEQDSIEEKLVAGTKEFDTKLENMREEIEQRILSDEQTTKMIAKLNQIPNNVGESVIELNKKLEFAMKALAARLEGDKFLASEIDGVADGMTNKFLQNVVGDTDALKGRVKVLEDVNAAGAKSDDDNDEKAAPAPAPDPVPVGKKDTDETEKAEEDADPEEEKEEKKDTAEEEEEEEEEDDQEQGIEEKQQQVDKDLIGDGIGGTDSSVELKAI